ncbi:MAG: AIR synthase related protein [Acidimicrobiales bacterium]
MAAGTGAGTASEDAYRSSGVDYGVLDAAKRRSMQAVLASLAAPANRGALVASETVGEPAQLVEVDGVQLATVLECLGTKSEIAREVEESLAIDRWEAIGIDAVAAIVNDLSCAGALPISVSAYFATGSAGWYSGARHESLVAGWQRACAEAGAAWVGGESPTLSGIVGERAVDIAGSAIGRIPAGCRAWLGSRLEPSDEIVLVESSGLHANGASLARAVASSSPDGWATVLPSGQRFGEAVLEPSVIYVRLVEALQSAPFHDQLRYASHITGHGLRKLMRADRELTYRVSALLPVPEVLSWLAERAGLDAAGAYGTFNMGVGFAVFAAAGAGEQVCLVAESLGLNAIVAGAVETGARRVILEPLGIEYSSEELDLR